MSYVFNKPNKNHPRPFFRHTNFSVMEAGNDKFPEMVEVVKGPAWGKYIVGRKYLSAEFAVKAITAAHAEHMVSGGAKQAKMELMDLGFGEDIVF
jgi:hypothetical protein